MSHKRMSHKMSHKFSAKNHPDTAEPNPDPNRVSLSLTQPNGKAKKSFDEAQPNLYPNWLLTLTLISCAAAPEGVNSLDGGVAAEPTFGPTLPPSTCNAASQGV